MDLAPSVVIKRGSSSLGGGSGSARLERVRQQQNKEPPICVRGLLFQARGSWPVKNASSHSPSWGVPLSRWHPHPLPLKTLIIHPTAEESDPFPCWTFQLSRRADLECSRHRTYLSTTPIKRHPAIVRAAPYHGMGEVNPFLWALLHSFGP